MSESNKKDKDNSNHKYMIAELQNKFREKDKDFDTFVKESLEDANMDREPKVISDTPVSYPDEDRSVSTCSRLVKDVISEMTLKERLELGRYIDTSIEYILELEYIYGDMREPDDKKEVEIIKDCIRKRIQNFIDIKKQEDKYKTDVSEETCATLEDNDLHPKKDFLNSISESLLKDQESKVDTRYPRFQLAGSTNVMGYELEEYVDNLDDYEMKLLLDRYSLLDICERYYINRCHLKEPSLTSVMRFLKKTNQFIKVSKDGELFELFEDENGNIQLIVSPDDMYVFMNGGDKNCKNIDYKVKYENLKKMINDLYSKLY